MSHHLHLLRGIPANVAVTEDPAAVVTDPLPRRVSPRTAMHWRELARLDQEIAQRAVVNRARDARAGGWMRGRT